MTTEFIQSLIYLISEKIVCQPDKRIIDETLKQTLTSRARQNGLVILLLLQVVVACDVESSPKYIVTELVQRIYRIYQQLNSDWLKCGIDLSEIDK